MTSVQNALPKNWSHGQDLVIYPSLLLGELVAEKSILPIRTRLLEQENYVFDDVFPYDIEQERFVEPALGENLVVG